MKKVVSSDWCRDTPSCCRVLHLLASFPEILKMQVSKSGLMNFLSLALVQVACAVPMNEYNGYPVEFIRHAIPNPTVHTPWNQWTEGPYVFIGYHGTSQYGAKGIANEGYNVGFASVNSAGAGLYVTPHVETARFYGTIPYVDDDDVAQTCYFFAPKSLMNERLAEQIQDAINDSEAYVKSHQEQGGQQKTRVPWQVVYPVETLPRLKAVCIPFFKDVPVQFPFSYVETPAPGGLPRLVTIDLENHRS